MTVKEAQELVEVWNSKHSIHNSELTSMVNLTEKIGELASAIARKQVELGSVHNAETPLSAEISDIFWEILSLCAQSGIDLTEALINNLEKRNNL